MSRIASNMRGFDFLSCHTFVLFDEAKSVEESRVAIDLQQVNQGVALRSLSLMQCRKSLNLNLQADLKTATGKIAFTDS